MPTTRAQLVRAAFDLFETEGYDATTVDNIASRAGVGRTTFFRTFRNKDEVVFPDHGRILAGMQQRLDGAAHSAVGSRDAALFVLQQFLDEGELAFSRYRLTSTVPALRDRELASISVYQPAGHLATWGQSGYHRVGVRHNPRCYLCRCAGLVADPVDRFCGRAPAHRHDLMTLTS